MKKLNGFYSNDYSSKIKHILSLADLGNNRVSCIRRSFTAPTPEFVMDNILKFDKKKTKIFSDIYLAKYETMMSNILNSFTL
jgi:hypothetical protein